MLLNCPSPVDPVDIRPLNQGHSNKNFLIRDSSSNEYVLRIARKNRTEESVLAEELLLEHLKENSFHQAPVLLSRCPYPLKMNRGERFVHLFHKLPGSIPCCWWQPCSRQQLKQLFAKLAALHKAMKGLPPFHGPKLTAERYHLPATPPPILHATATGRYVAMQWQKFCQKATQLQQDVLEYFPWDKVCLQWVHGDIQLENVLFDSRDRLSAILDFEWIHWDACEKDLIFSAFRVCKEGKQDNSFHYDPFRFKLALDEYLKNENSLYQTFFSAFDELWKPYFCFDQSMIYLRNAFDGVWTLKKNIGFLPCFDAVLNYNN